MDALAVKDARKMATISLVVGLAGMALPVLPGWLLVLSSIGTFARIEPRLEYMDRLIQRRFPLTSRDAAFLAEAFAADLELRFGERARRQT
jgi:hypothetical protein